jgi:predicted MFS family arabinose efflux permease
LGFLAGLVEQEHRGVTPPFGAPRKNAACPGRAAGVRLGAMAYMDRLGSGTGPTRTGLTQTPEVTRKPGVTAARITLTAALLGFFMISLDATAVNVALPAIGRTLGGTTAGLQWTVDGYTLPFAALLISAGAVSDRAGARRVFGCGLAVFVAASAACGLAPQLGVLVGARVVQGGSAAVMLPASLALYHKLNQIARPGIMTNLS